MQSFLKKKVQVWIYCKNLEGKWFFLILRTLPHRGGFWQPVTGSVHEAESLEQAALREAQEETGLAFYTMPQPLDTPFEFEKRGCHFKEYGFSLESPLSKSGLFEVVLDSHEHNQFQWVSAEEALTKIKYSSNKQMLECLLKALNISN